MGHRFDSDDQDKRDAELGYRTAGQRELALRDWMAMQGDPGEVAPTSRRFASLVNVLRAKKWAKENPERRREIANRYALKPENLARSVANARKRRLERHRSAPPIKCEECGVEFCSVKVTKSVPRRFCTVNCTARAKWHRQHPYAPRRKTVTKPEPTR